jgi:molybdate transport system ATP-binding protein
MSPQDPPIALDVHARLSIGLKDTAFALEVSFQHPHGVLVLYGPSGAGKTLTLELIAGLTRPQSGSLRMEGEILFDHDTGVHVPAHHRSIGYVPQHHVLFPFCDVLDNVLFGLPRRQRKRANPKVIALMDELGIAHLRQSSTQALSGGERQRVALARALIVEPRLLLLDEPFASIDTRGRSALRGTLCRVLSEHDIPAVFVTHDANEARAIGDHMVLFERGSGCTMGNPTELLQRTADSESVSG